MHLIIVIFIAFLQFYAKNSNKLVLKSRGKVEK